MPLLLLAPHLHRPHTPPLLPPLLPPQKRIKGVAASVGGLIIAVASEAQQLMYRFGAIPGAGAKGEALSYGPHALVAFLDGSAVSSVKRDGNATMRTEGHTGTFIAGCLQDSVLEGTREAAKVRGAMGFHERMEVVAILPRKQISEEAGCLRLFNGTLERVCATYRGTTVDGVPVVVTTRFEPSMMTLVRHIFTGAGLCDSAVLVLSPDDYAAYAKADSFAGALLAFLKTHRFTSSFGGVHAHLLRKVTTLWAALLGGAWLFREAVRVDITQRARVAAAVSGAELQLSAEHVCIGADMSFGEPAILASMFLCVHLALASATCASDITPDAATTLAKRFKTAFAGYQATGVLATPAELFAEGPAIVGDDDAMVLDGAEAETAAAGGGGGPAAGAASVVAGVFAGAGTGAASGTRDRAGAAPAFAGIFAGAAAAAASGARGAAGAGRNASAAGAGSSLEAEAFAGLSDHLNRCQDGELTEQIKRFHGSTQGAVWKAAMEWASLPEQGRGDRPPFPGVGEIVQLRGKAAGYIYGTGNQRTVSFGLPYLKALEKASLVRLVEEMVAGRLQVRAVFNPLSDLTTDYARKMLLLPLPLPKERHGDDPVEWYRKGVRMLPLAGDDLTAFDAAWKAEWDSAAPKPAPAPQLASVSAPVFAAASSGRNSRTRQREASVTRQRAGSESGDEGAAGARSASAGLPPPHPRSRAGSDADDSDIRGRLSGRTSRQRLAQGSEDEDAAPGDAGGAAGALPPLLAPQPVRGPLPRAFAAAAAPSLVTPHQGGPLRAAGSSTVTIPVGSAPWSGLQSVASRRSDALAPALVHLGGAGSTASAADSAEFYISPSQGAQDGAAVASEGALPLSQPRSVAAGSTGVVLPGMLQMPPATPPPPPGDSTAAAVPAATTNAAAAMPPPDKTPAAQAAGAAPAAEAAAARRTVPGWTSQ